MLPVATRREHGTDSPSELPEEASLPEPRFWTSGLQNWKRINFWGFPGGSVVKNPSANAGDTEDSGLIPGSGSPPGVGNGNLLQYCCLENPMDRGAWSMGHRELGTTEQLTHTQKVEIVEIAEERNR